MCACARVRVGINAHTSGCLPARAAAQHLLGCVCAELCEGLEPKALTRHYTADKAICDEGPRSISSSLLALAKGDLALC